MKKQTCFSVIAWFGMPVCFVGLAAVPLQAQLSTYAQAVVTQKNVTGRPDQASANGQPGRATWSMGINIVTTDIHDNSKYTAVPNTGSPATGTYAAGAPDVLAQRTGNGNEATALTTLAIQPAQAAGFFDSTMKTEAKVKRDSIFNAFPGALAQGKEPQYLESPGWVMSEIELGAGSAVYAANPGTDLAYVNYQFFVPFHTSPGDPAASILLDYKADGMEATVFLNSSDTRLSFYAPGTSTPISNTDIETLLEGSSVGSAAGLSTNLPLFRYEYNLTGASLSELENEYVGYSGIAEAQMLPEPSSLGLLAIGGICVVRRRQQQRRGESSRARRRRA